MRYLMLILSVSLILTGCAASNNKGKLEGTKWSSLATIVKGQPVPAGGMKLEFKDDGVMVMQVNTVVRTGHYSLGGGNSVTFHLHEELSGRKTHVETITINDDGSRLTMIDSDGTTVTFQKTAGR
jgi:hypothetical protein